MTTQTKATPTPGPWLAKWNGVYGAQVFGGDDKTGSSGVAIVGGGNGVQMANARLIAASPDLLKACRDVADEIESTFSDVELVTSETLLGGFRDTLRAAIAKAEGTLDAG